MPALKLSTAVFLCAHHPSRWGRTVTTTTTVTSLTTPLSLSLTPNTSWRRLAQCAHLPFYDFSFNSHNHHPNYFLGFAFRGQPHNSHFSPLSLPSSSSSRHFSSLPNKSGSDSSGSGLVADMGSENKVDGVNWFGNNNDGISGQNHQHDKPSKVLTLPTILTLGRVAAVPLLVCTFYMDSWWGRTATTSIFVAAAITDWLDGYLARKMRLGSAFGAFLDPVADKLMVAATLVLLCTRPFDVAMFGPVQWLLTVPSIAIIGREITMSAVREWAASQNSKLLEAVAVNNLGKWKTATQMTALTILLATRDISAGGTGAFVATGVVLLYISAGLSVWSLAVYMSKIWRILLK